MRLQLRTWFFRVCVIGSLVMSLIWMSRSTSGQGRNAKQGLTQKIHDKNTIQNEPEGDRWVDRRRKAFSAHSPSKVLLFTYMRGGSSIGGELFDLDPRAFSWYEPMDGFFSYFLGLRPAQIPYNYIYNNQTRRAYSADETEKMVNFLKNIYSCRYKALPVETLSHSFLRQSTAMDDYVSCFKQLPQNATARFCKRFIRDICGATAASSLQARCPQLVAASEQGVRIARDQPLPADDVIIREMTQELRSLKDGIDTESSHLESFVAYQKCLLVSRTETNRCLPKAVKKCRSSRLHVLKVNRMKMEDLDPVLEAIPDLKVIYYTRDPRAIALSRSGIRGFTWDTNNPSPLQELKFLCPRMEEDIKHKRRLVKKYPGAIMHIRYEDFVTDPLSTASKLYSHFYRTVPKKWEILSKQKFTAHGGRQGKFGNAVKNVTMTINRWQQQIPNKQLLRADTLCAQILDGLGYQSYSSLTALH